MDENNSPQEFNSPVLEAAIALHEMFVTLMQAGFTEPQALIMVTEVMKGVGQ